MDKGRVAINALIMDRHKAGIGNYAFQLVKAMGEAGPADLQIDVHIQPHMRPLFQDTPRLKFVTHRDFKSSRERILYEQFNMPGVYNRGGYNVVHFVDYLSPLSPVKARKVFTFHDLSYFKLPESFTTGSRVVKQVFTGLGVRRADRIICVSHNTRKDLMERYPYVDGDRIKVIHLAATPAAAGQADRERDRDILSEYGVSDDFILYVGTLEPRKNIELLLDAYLGAVQRADIPWKLVLCGKQGWKYRGVFERLANPLLKDRVIVTGYVPDDRLPVFYHCAALFVYPSLYEGFGLPPLEALSWGTAVITSNASSLPEVVGDAALTFDPADPLALEELIVRVAGDESLRRSLADKGPKQASRFSWAATAQKTLDVYRELL